MITIICGEDTAASRNYFTSHLDTLKAAGHEVVHLTPAQLESQIKDAETAPTLFGSPQAFAVANIGAYIKKNSASKLPAYLEAYEKSKENHIVDWEDGVAARELRLKVGTVKELKVSESIFKLLDALYPKNLNAALQVLRSVEAKESPVFVITMLGRHVRKLLITAGGGVVPGMQDWQRGKIKSQSARWSRSNLESLYQALIRLDIAIKTSDTPIPPMKMLEVTFCYYLK